MKNLTLRQIRIFVEVARRLSFARAAQALSLTPPAVTMQIHELETQVGLPLLNRDGRSVSLTMGGEYFLIYARRVLSTLKDARDTLDRFRQVQTGQLVIGMVSTAQYFVPPLLARFCKQHPGVEVSLVVGNRQTLVEQLRHNEVDLAIMGRPPRQFATRAEPFALHPLFFVAAPDHPLAQLKQLPPRALAEHDFIVREPGSGTRAVLEDYLRQHQLTPRITMEMSGNETIKQAVMAGMGISLLSLHTLELELRGRQIALLDIQQTPVLRRWYVVNTLSKILSPPAEAFRQFIFQQAEDCLRQRFGPAPMAP